ncbi:MAG: hypothetical protein LBG84_09440 [Treponema sp.]|jgi:hypothetical protein|nr:hypothetical protein [Treponema sp.]
MRGLKRLALLFCLFAAFPALADELSFSGSLTGGPVFGERTLGFLGFRLGAGWEFDSGLGLGLETGFSLGFPGVLSRVPLAASVSYRRALTEKIALRPALLLEGAFLSDPPNRGWALIPGPRLGVEVGLPWEGWAFSAAAGADLFFEGEGKFTPGAAVSLGVVYRLGMSEAQRRERALRRQEALRLAEEERRRREALRREEEEERRRREEAQKLEALRRREEEEKQRLEAQRQEEARKLEAQRQEEERRRQEGLLAQAEALRRQEEEARKLEAQRQEEEARQQEGLLAQAEALRRETEARQEAARKALSEALQRGTTAAVVERLAREGGLTREQTNLLQRITPSATEWKKPAYNKYRGSAANKMQLLEDIRTGKLTRLAD